MQQRLRDYKQGLPSFLHNVMNLGMHNPGRFCGFDKLQPTGALAFTLAHTSGFTFKDEIGNTTGPCGLYMTPQGDLIREDASITGFAIETNIGNASDRYDLIVATHNYVSVQGGQPATYSIVKGPINNPILPALPDPNHQTILGIIRMIEQSSSLVDFQFYYTPARSPDSGDSPDARLNEPNEFKALQQWSQSPEYHFGKYPHEPADYYTFPDTGNLLRMVQPSNSTSPYYIKGIKFLNVGQWKNGTSMDVYVQANVFFQQVPITSGNAAEGYSPLKLPTAFQTGKAGNYPAIATQKDKPVMLRLLKMDGDIYIVSVTPFLPDEAAEATPSFKIHYAGNIYLGDKPTAPDQLVRVIYGDANPTFPPIPEGVSGYNLQVTLVSQGNWNIDNDVIAMVQEKDVNGFYLAFKEFGSGGVDNLSVDILVTIFN